MTLDEFKKTLSGKKPPADASAILQAMWHQANGNWDLAHSIAQKQKNPDGDWVHAFLHRVEGDLANAGYWYRQAGKTAASGSLSEEWDQLASAFL